MSEFLIMFREVLEGVLVVGILYTFIVKTGRDHLKRSIINGIIASFIATGIFAVVFQILYGGSVNLGNAEDLIQVPGVDGFLIGGASLDIESFTSIARTVEMVQEKKI